MTSDTSESRNGTLAYRRVEKDGGLVAIFDVTAGDRKLHLRYDEAERDRDGQNAGVATYAWSVDDLAGLHELLREKFTGTALEDEARALLLDVADALRTG